MEPQIIVRELCKYYKVTEKAGGLGAAVKGIFHPVRTIVKAVDHINFEIGKGEIVGFLGGNGAGKSTTIKMLSGILQPTGGDISINQYSPYRQRKKVVRDLGVVFGQRSQLFWELRLGESFELIRRIYQVGESEYHKNLEELDEILDFTGFINTPVRQLSLGQRMRGDLVAAMLYKPSILFLDEPTIGLDIQTKQAVREFIRKINTDRQVTVLLTTHDMSDIEALCSRLILINEGKILEDGELSYFISKFAPYREMILSLKKPFVDIREIEGVTVDNTVPFQLTLRFQSAKISANALLAKVSETIPVSDIKIKEPGVEDVIAALNQKEGVEESADR